MMVEMAMELRWRQHFVEEVKNSGSLLRGSALLIAVWKIRISRTFCCEIIPGPFTKVAWFDGVDPTDMSMVGGTVGSNRIGTRYVLFRQILDLLDFWQLPIRIISS